MVAADKFRKQGKEDTASALDASFNEGASSTKPKLEKEAPSTDVREGEKSTMEEAMLKTSDASSGDSSSSTALPGPRLLEAAPPPLLHEGDGESLDQELRLAGQCSGDAEMLDADINVELLKHKLYSHMTEALNAGQFDLKMATAFASTRSMSEHRSDGLRLEGSLEAKAARLEAELKAARAEVDALRKENADLRLAQKQAADQGEGQALSGIAAGSGLRAVRASHGPD